MLNFITKLFGKKEKIKVEFMHDKLGHLQYVDGDNFWETTKSEIYHSLPGDINAPSDKASEFLSDKIASIEKYWGVCSKELLEIAHSWESIDKSLSAKELFKVSGISVRSNELVEWEICFETKPENKWIFIGLHFDGDEIVANDIAT